MVVSIAQDVLFAGFFALFFIRIVELIIRKDLNRKKLYSLIFMDVLGICFFRNNGFYALIIALPFLYFIDRRIKYKAIIISMVLVPMILYKLTTSLIYPMIGVIKDTDAIKEMSSVPSQQMARVLYKNQNAYSETDYEELKKYYKNIDRLRIMSKYNPSIADYLKNELNQKYVNDNKFDYLKFWIKIGIKNPKEYTEAFLLNNLGLWYPNKNYPDSRMYHPIIEYKNTDISQYNKETNSNYQVGVIRQSKIPIYEKILKKIVYENKWEKIPIISTIYTMGFYFLLYIFTIGICIVNKKYKLLIPLGVILGYYCTLFLGPVSLFRYAFPIIILSPFFIVFICNKKGI